MGEHFQYALATKTTALDLRPQTTPLIPNCAPFCSNGITRMSAPVRSLIFCSHSLDAHHWTLMKPPFFSMILASSSSEFDVVVIDESCLDAFSNNLA